MAQSTSDVAQGPGHSSVYSNPNGMPFANGRNLHMDLQRGDIASRIITVGSLGRAEIISSFLDVSPAPKRITSSRGFTTITGTYQGVEVSIVSIGMGPSMMDFFVRETRAVTPGPLIMVRFGTCGGLTETAVPGSIVVASKGSGYVTRNPDAFIHCYFDDVAAVGERPAAYNFAKVAPSNAVLSGIVMEELSKAVGEGVVLGGLNVTAESFYSSQGRIDEAFDDENTSIVSSILAAYEGAQSMEMETFMLLHLAKCSKVPIHATAAAIVVANRVTNTVVEGDVLERLESSGGRAVLNAIIAMDL